MTILIAGRPVKKGDRLYHRILESWGTVTGYDPSGSAQLTIRGKGGIRKMLVRQGGMVNNRRAVQWHPDIKLDMPFADISAVQRVVDVLASELITRD